MSKNRIKLNICGTDYVIISDETEEYMRNIADEVSDEMDEILKTNVRVSVVMAAVLTALKYCDESKKYMSDADNLRTQIKDYLEEDVAFGPENLGLSSYEIRMRVDKALKAPFILKALLFNDKSVFQIKYILEYFYHNFQLD